MGIPPEQQRTELASPPSSELHLQYHFSGLATSSFKQHPTYLVSRIPALTEMGAGKSKGDNEDQVDRLVREAPNDQLLAAARDLPLPRGHGLLRDFADALDGEYARREGPV